MKRVYTLVFFEQSPEAFHEFPDCWLHKFRQHSDTGLELELLQEYVFIPLDIYRKSRENKAIETILEAWLAFLSFTEPKRIEELIVCYPRFKAMYLEIYDLCQNTEKVMNVYSKELQLMDHNTVMYMIDKLHEQIDQDAQEMRQMGQELKQKDEKLEQTGREMRQMGQELKQKDEKLEQTGQELKQKDQEIAALKAQLAALQG